MNSNRIFFHRRYIRYIHSISGTSKKSHKLVLLSTIRSMLIKYISTSWCSIWWRELPKSLFKLKHAHLEKRHVLYVPKLHNEMPYWNSSRRYSHRNRIIKTTPQYKPVWRQECVTQPIDALITTLRGVW